VEVDTKKLAALCARLGIRRLSVFGSVARGEATPESDIDLLAEFTERVTLLDLVRAERELADELGHPVDLLTPAALSPHLRDRIQKEARVLYERTG
jgi:predicted nucleotidyltransferase